MRYFHQYHTKKSALLYLVGMYLRYEITLGTLNASKGKSRRPLELMNTFLLQNYNLKRLLKHRYTFLTINIVCIIITKFFY